MECRRINIIGERNYRKEEDKNIRLSKPKSLGRADSLEGYYKLLEENELYPRNKKAVPMMKGELGVDVVKIYDIQENKHYQLFCSVIVPPNRSPIPFTPHLREYRDEKCEDWETLQLVLQAGRLPSSLVGFCCYSRKNTEEFLVNTGSSWLSFSSFTSIKGKDYEIDCLFWYLPVHDLALDFYEASRGCYEGSAYACRQMIEIWRRLKPLKGIRPYVEKALEVAQKEAYIFSDDLHVDGDFFSNTSFSELVGKIIDAHLSNKRNTPDSFFGMIHSKIYLDDSQETGEIKLPFVKTGEEINYNLKDMELWLFLQELRGRVVYDPDSNYIGLLPKRIF